MFTCAIVSLVVYQTSWQRIPKICSKYCIITQVGEDCITSEWLGLIIFGFGSKKTLEKWWENDRKRVADFSYPHWGGLHGVHVTSHVMVDNHIASGALCISISMVDNVLSNLFRSGMWESYMFEVCLAFRKNQKQLKLRFTKEERERFPL